MFELENDRQAMVGFCPAHAFGGLVSEFSPTEKRRSDEFHIQSYEPAGPVALGVHRWKEPSPIFEDDLLWRVMEIGVPVFGFQLIFGHLTYFADATSFEFFH